MAINFETEQQERMQRSQGNSRMQQPLHEGRLTKATESVTARIPSMTYLDIAVGAMVTSAALQLMGRRHMSLFVGQWVPTILIMGLYNKLVKVAGSDATS